MSIQRHWTTRRGFIATMGFGAVGLYGAWAAYGAAPLPFSTASGGERAGDAHGAAPPAAEGGHGAPGSLSPEEFLRRHEQFLTRFRQPDGAVAPRAESDATAGAHLAATPPAGAHAGQDAHGTAPAGGHGAPVMAPAGGHGSAHGAPGLAPGGHGAPHGSSIVDPDVTAPVDVYLRAFQFGFEPDDLRLDAGQPYRFRMMASDIAHGASLQLGPASRIVRLRPNVVSEQTFTFLRPGTHLVYCTVYCGLAHDAMSGRIVVA